MSFLRSLLNGRKDLQGLKRYVELEYAPAERDAAYIRLVNEAQL